MPRHPTTTRDSSRHQPSSSSTSMAAPAVVAPPGHSNRQPMALAAARMGKRAVAVTAPSANNAGPYAQRCSRPACGHPQPAAAPEKSSKLKRISAWLKGNKAQDQGRVPARKKHPRKPWLWFTGNKAQDQGWVLAQKKHPRKPWLCRDGEVEETFSLIAEAEESKPWLCKDGEVEETFSLIAETEERLTRIETKIDEEADDDDAPAVHHTKEIQNTEDARRIVVFNDISAGSNQDKDMSTPMPDTRRDSAGSSTYFTPQSFSYSIELAQYWLEHIHMAESRGNHQLAATSFQSAFELNAEPIEIIRRELLAYTMRHEDAMDSAPLLWHLLATYCDIIVRQPTFGEGHKEQASTHKEAVWLVTWARKIGAWLRSGKRKIFA